MWRSIFTPLIFSMLVLSATAYAAMQERTASAGTPATQETQRKPKTKEKTSDGLSLTEKQAMATTALNTLIAESVNSMPDQAALNIYSVSELTAQSILLLWKHDPEKAASYFKEFGETLLDMYERSRRAKTDEEKINNTRRTLKHVISLWALKDFNAATRLLQSLHKFDEESGLSSAPRLRASEQFELAKDLLDSAPQQSANLVAQVIETSIPSGFPEYLLKLRRRDPAAAERILVKCLAILATGQIYSAKQDLLIQAYIFREPMVIYPVNEPVDFPGFEALPFPAGGVITIEFAFNSSDTPAAQEFAAYTNASLSSLNKKLSGASNLSGLEAATAYFLVQKLIAFFARAHVAVPDDLSRLESMSTGFATNGGVSEPNLTHLALVAREVTAKNFLHFLRDNATAAAEKSNDLSLKSQVLEKEILGDIAASKFDAASEKLFKLDDSDTREAIADYLYVARIMDALKKGDWDAANNYLEKVKNWNVKTYALLEAARHALKTHAQPQVEQYLQAARKTIEGKLNVDEQPQMLAGLLAIMAASNANDLEWCLFATVQGINKPFEEDDNADTWKAKKGIFIRPYVGNEIWIYSRGIVAGAIRYQSKNFNLETAFTEAAKRQWLAAYTAALGIKPNSLRHQAILGACRSVL